MKYRNVSMSRVTEGGHSADFLKRILDAMDMSPMEASAKFDIPLADILAMYKGSRKQVAEIDKDELWVKIAEYVDLRIGLMLSVRKELQHKLNVDIAERQAQRLRTLNR